jgi:preprotein translocase subunit SecB
MADTGSSNGGASQPQANQAAQQPAIHVLSQYIKDLSFENPNAPRSLRAAETQPTLNVNVNVNARPMSQTDFEIELKLDAQAKRDDETMFIIEVTYAGLFQIRNVPPEHMQPLVLIECPRLLFPFARQIVADATRQGGFAALMLDPLDFTALYRRRVAEMAQQQPAPPQAS